MAKKEIYTILTQIGLSKNEARVYLASLSLGPATILDIAKTAEIKRTTVYAVAEALQRKGLMNIELKGLKQLYAAENPKRLERMLEERQNQFRNLMPELSALHNLKGTDSTVKYYEGLESIKSAYEQLLADMSPHEEYLAISNSDQWINIDAKWFQNFVEKRAKLPIQTRLLLQTSDDARWRKKFMRNFNYTVKLLPQTTKLTTSLTITPQRVVVHQLTSPIIAIAIENPSMINMHKEMFEIMWTSITSTESENKKSD